eukprot:TRINITY_DN711_c3_g1_i1.p1 TRINITY_DN711_c3_g1~~TRINITY_DN711_c3_g1_i1.p1  ORF type:complete len:174 (+),score=32.84 TRINITY_DN711_c3_g1_i1:23-544(+)
MPTVYLKKGQIESIHPKDRKNTVYLRTRVELYGSPVSAVVDIIDLLQGLTFRSTDGSRQELLSFEFNNGRFVWLSDVVVIRTPGKKDELDVYMDNPTPWIVTDEIWDYVIEPHIVDILLGRGWSLTSNTDETMVFYKLNVGDVPHYSDVIRPITRGMIEDARTEKEDRKRSVL